MIFVSCGHMTCRRSRQQEMVHAAKYFSDVIERRMFCEGLRSALPYGDRRRNKAPFIELRAAEWGGVRVELVTRETDGPCDGGMCVPHHVVSFLTEGRRSGLINSIAGSTPRRVGHDAGWTRIARPEAMFSRIGSAGGVLI